MPRSNLLIGLGSAVAIIFIWSGFMVFSRAGMITALTPFDVVGLRFVVAGLLVLPFLWKWWPWHLPFHARHWPVSCWRVMIEAARL